ncbi:Protein kinase-like domain [Pseudocohnilembus persalinus]|uniref:Protein kinase-like domain n=1 Tax=Pseudocohnilembus persalinus TaxID=266149 RepID=A0A0V0QXL7_PSEPJ|nr:Protein kinase-like domain [Pseudocohnilembus persalinus]|eukprot:KRX06978.1 Protein kinase-like domain [Pseudocohnilembus persalinus]
MENKKKVNKKVKIGQNWVVDRGIILGQGQLGTVYEGFSTHDKKYKVAIKEYNISTIEQFLGDQTKQYLEREVSVMMKVQNKNIVKILDLKQTKPSPSETYLFIIMEKLSGGTLQQKIFKENYIPEELAQITFKQIMEGYSSIVKYDAIHRDLKPANIIFDEEQQIAKIADFGLAKFLLQNEQNQEQTIFITNRGTPHYKCPELLTSDEYIEVKQPQKIDIWSLGVILYEMLYGKIPWNSHQNQDIAEFYQTITTTQIQFPENIQVQQSTKNLILGMLELDSQKRFSYEQCMQHPFLK